MRAVFNSLFTVIGIPALVASIYFFALASDIFVSEARFSIRSASGNVSATGLAALLSTSGVASGSQDSMVVTDYVQSQDMLAVLQDHLDVRAHFSNPEIDPLARLPADATREEFVEYFRKRLTVTRDTASDVITLTARGFSPWMAQRIAEVVIEQSEQLVNAMSNRIEEDALATAHAEVERAASRLRKIASDITQFRNNNASLNPTEESSALLGLISGIEGKLVESRTELGEKRAFMREDSPEIVMLKNRVNALERQLRLERGRLAGAGGNEMSDLIEGYQPLILEQEIAQQQYASALTSMEVARVEAQRQKQYLITFVQPDLPDEAVEPRRFRSVLTVILYAFLVYLIGALLWSALKDHVGR